MGTRNLAAAVAMIILPALAAAQTGPCPTANPGFVANPIRGCFLVVAAEHNAVDPITQVPLITRYDLLFFDEAADVTNPAVQPIQTSSIGKPAIAAGTTNTIWIGDGSPTPLPSYPLGRRLKTLTQAVGPGGSSPREVGAVSNPFGRSNPPTAPAAPTSTRLLAS